MPHGRAPQSLLSFPALIRRLHSPHDRVEEIAFRKRAFQRLLFIDHRLGNGMDTILADKVGKFCGLNAVGRDVLVLHRKLVRQTDRLRTMGSGGSDKDLKVDRLVEAGKLFLALRIQSRVAF
jgi:hypothetical protein